MKKILRLSTLFFALAVGCILRSIWVDNELIARWAITGIVLGFVGAFISFEET